MASRNSLSDDWEDVGDDNLSVISFSTAEPDADVATTTSKSDDNSMPTELDAAENETSLASCQSFLLHFVRRSLGSALANGISSSDRLHQHLNHNRKHPPNLKKSGEMKTMTPLRRSFPARSNTAHLTTR